MTEPASSVAPNKRRSSNMDLLRVVAMLMIIAYHIVVHCVNVQLTSPASLGRAAVDTFNHPVVYRRLLLLDTAMPLGLVGNALFILISGYFMAQRVGGGFVLAR